MPSKVDRPAYTANFATDRTDTELSCSSQLRIELLLSSITDLIRDWCARHQTELHCATMAASFELDSCHCVTAFKEVNTPCTYVWMCIWWYLQGMYLSLSLWNLNISKRHPCQNIPNICFLGLVSPQPTVNCNTHKFRSRSVFFIVDMNQTSLWCGVI